MTSTQAIEAAAFDSCMRPKLRENVWHVYPDMDRVNLITTRGVYNAPTDAALAFMKMRTFCNGYNSIATIAVKSGFSVADVISCLQSLRPSGIIYSLDDPVDELPEEDVRALLLQITAIWANELKAGYIANQFAMGVCRAKRSSAGYWKCSIISATSPKQSHTQCN